MLLFWNSGLSWKRYEWLPFKALKALLITWFYTHLICCSPLTKTRAGECTWLKFTSISFQENTASEWLKAPAKKLCFGTTMSWCCWQVSTHAAAGAGYPVGKSRGNDQGMINLDVRTLSGDEFTLRVERSMRGLEVRKMVLDHLPVRSGAKLVLDHMRKHQTSEQEKEIMRLKLHQTLQEHGLAEVETAILCCTYVPTQLHTAWCFLMGLEPSEAEFSLEGVTDLRTPSPVGLLNPPKSLVSFTFGDDFDESLEGLTLPSSLQSLTFGKYFNRSLEGVSLPNNLQNLTFGSSFNQSLERVTLPSSLQSLTFGKYFNRSLEGVSLPNNLQNLTFGSSFNQSLERATLPNSLRSLTLVLCSKGVWKVWPCQTVCRIWLLEINSIRAWIVWPCLRVCCISLLDIASTRL